MSIDTEHGHGAPHGEAGPDSPSVVSLDVPEGMMFLGKPYRDAEGIKGGHKSIGTTVHFVGVEPGLPEKIQAANGHGFDMAFNHLTQMGKDGAVEPVPGVRILLTRPLEGTDSHVTINTGSFEIVPVHEARSRIEISSPQSTI